MSVFETEPAGAPHELVRWTHRDALQTRLLAKAGNRRFAYAVGTDVPAVPLSPAALQALLEGIDALLYRDHDEAYLGIVYVDDLGATCGSIGYKVLVGGVARSLHGGLNRPFEGWVSNRSKKLSGIPAVADQLTAVRINTRTYHEETDMKTTRKPTPAPNGPSTGASSEPPSSTDEFQAQVAEAAYFLAERRGFSPGFEMEDWLAAEAQARARLENA